MTIQSKSVAPPPQGKIADTPEWRQWFQSVSDNSTSAYAIPSYPTAKAPTWSANAIGGVYFDTTLNKLRIAGAAGWETVTSV